MPLYTERLFLSVCEHGSFSGAAKEQHMTQPAVSMAVTALEEELGKELFIRSRGHRNLQLTSAGSRYRDYAREAVALYERMFVDLNHDIARDNLTLIASQAPSATILPPLLNAFRNAFPNINVRVITCVGTEVLPRLNAHEADIALSGIAEPGAAFRNERFFYDPLILIAPKDMPVKETITLRQFQKLPIVVRQKNNARDIILRTLDKHGVPLDKLNTVMQVFSDPDIYQAVTFGSGVGFVTKSRLMTTPDYYNKVKIIKISTLEFPRYVHLVRSAGRQLGQGAKLFWDFAKTDLWREGIYRYETLPVS